MGAYKYLEEVYKHKQSDLLRFLLRVRYAKKKEEEEEERENRKSER